MSVPWPIMAWINSPILGCIIFRRCPYCTNVDMMYIVKEKEVPHIGGQECVLLFHIRRNLITDYSYINLFICDYIMNSNK